MGSSPASKTYHLTTDSQTTARTLLPVMSQNMVTGTIHPVTRMLETAQGDILFVAATSAYSDQYCPGI